MAKRKRHRKMAGWRKWARTGLGAAGAVIGALVATSPVHRGLGQMATGSWQQGLDSIAYDIGAPVPRVGINQPDVGKLVGTAVTVGVGIGIMSLFRFVARRI